MPVSDTQLQLLIDKVLAGDEAARSALLDHACDRLLRLTRKMFHARKVLRRWEQTDDVFQNAMLRLHRALSEVKPESVRHFFNLAAVMIRRTLLDLAKHHLGPHGEGTKHHTDGQPADDEGGALHDRAEQPEDLQGWSAFHAQVESLPDFDTAARLDPKNAEVCMNRGIAYLNLLRFDEALTDLRHALELDPDHPEPYRKVLGEAYARRAFEQAEAKKWKEAIADFDEAIRFDPANASYFNKRGSMHFNLGEFEEARKDFTEAIRLDSNQPTYFLHRGFAHEALGKKDEAAEDYKKGKKQSPPK